MKEAFICFALIAVMPVYWYLDFRVACFSSLIIWTFIFSVYWYAVYRQKINFYRSIYTDIFVISRHPQSDDCVVLDETIEAIIFHVDFVDVLSTVEECKRWLVKAENKHYCDDSLNANQRLCVEGLIFRDGEFVTEKWKHFRKRVESTINQRLIARHSLMKRSKPDWYNEVSNKQILKSDDF